MGNEKEDDRYKEALPLPATRPKSTFARTQPSPAEYHELGTLWMSPRMLHAQYHKKRDTTEGGLARSLISQQHNESLVFAAPS